MTLSKRAMRNRKRIQVSIRIQDRKLLDEVRAKRGWSLTDAIAYAIVALCAAESK
jgi:hypothetical protein